MVKQCQVCRKLDTLNPNLLFHRLDRKSSRGMLYENEELRLKTININAEIERGQSDIKKLKRENEMLKKEIWCLRDEYDKLDKMLKDKKIDFSSSSTTYSSSSESESCSSCTEESEEVETSQNLKNVQKTNLKNIHDQFDHLSIVTEETSFDNSDKNSTNTRHSLPNDQNDNMLWNYNDKDVIKPDQSYPVYGTVGQNRSQTLPNQMHVNYFAPIQHSKSFDDNHFNQVHQTPLYPGDFYTPPLSCQNNGESQTPPIAISPRPPPLYENQQVVFPEHNNCEAENFLSKKIVHTNASNFYQNMVLVPKNVNPPPEVKSLEKKATDLIVKIDNQNFNRNLTYSNTTPSTTFSNGGNLEELLHDIESISQDILKLTHLQRGLPNSHQLSTIQEPSNVSTDFQDQNFVNLETQCRDLAYSENPVFGHLMNENLGSNQRMLTRSEERLHKSELNVILMPKAMPLIGFDKYKNIQRSIESLDSKHLDSMSASQQNLCVMPPHQSEEDLSRESSRRNLHVNLPVPPTAFQMDNSPHYNGMVEPGQQYTGSQPYTGGEPYTGGQPYTGKMENQEQNPFFFGNMNDNYVNSDYFSRRYNPENFIQKEGQENGGGQQEDKRDAIGAKIEDTHTPKATENDENIKLKTSKPDSKENKQEKVDKKQEQTKSPKMSITRKVSIHFKGKKEKDRLKKLALGGVSPELKSTSSKSALDGKKSSVFDFMINTDTPKDRTDAKDLSSPKLKDKSYKQGHQKTPSIESKKSTTETSNFDPKTPNSSESDKKNADKRDKDKDWRKEERKTRQSVSISPDRVKHVHILHDVQGNKKHKKHRRERSGASRTHRGSIMDPRSRERSFSICTDRSVVGQGLGLGMGYGSFLYEDYSDRERTNSGSSFESNENHRKMSGISNVPLNGKVPWCGCWGNGCL